MGLVSWLQSLRGNVRETITQSSPSRQRTSPTSRFGHLRMGSRNTPTPTNGQREQETEAKKDNRRSRRFSLAANKNRRSWFGGRPDTEEFESVPPMPVLKGHQRLGSNEHELSALPSPTTGPTKRYSMGRTYSRTDDAKNAGPVQALPPLPPMPVTVTQASQPATSSLPDAEKRKSRRQSMKSVKTLQRMPSEASMRTVTKRKSRNSFWKSSNPDESESDIPPVPALSRGDSTESTRDNSDTSEEPRQARRSVRVENKSGSHIRSKSAVSTKTTMTTMSTSSRKSYVPRSAAKGFLKSTNGASEESRKSFRKSFAMEDDAPMVCLTDEQQIEWAKLMAEGHKLTPLRPAETQSKTEEVDGRKFSNAQALAALEFGVK